MYADADPAAAERKAFRKAEKQYKIYKTPNAKGRARTRSMPTAGDLSAVVDFNALLSADGELPAGIGRCDCAGFECPVFCFLDRPGFYFIPGALSTDEQCYWIRESLNIFPQPPNRTNLTAIYGAISDLLVAAKKQKILVEVNSPDSQETNEQDKNGENTQPIKFKFMDDSEFPKGQACKSIAATTLVRKLRWSTLGLQFDWSKRNYDVSLPHNKIPDALAILAKKMAVPAMPCGQEFKPEAAIVNYYGSSDMLGGHVDDMEKDWTKPIVSISLGCKCIFLFGGKTRDEVPTAMFLRSGDIVLMAGEARERFHGVPRIFTENDQQDMSALVSQFSGEDEQFILDYIQNSRININIRQVY